MAGAGNLTVVPTAQFASAAAERILEAREQSGATFRIALSGARTPQPVYRILARKVADWSGWELFFGDERCVPPDNPLSNYFMAMASLKEAAGLSAASVHRMRGEADPEAAAREYEALLRRELGEGRGLDLVLLGIGANGHTASLFPGGPELEESERWVLPTRSPEPPVQRLSLTLPAIDASARVLFLVQGADKAPVLRQVLSGDTSLPAALVRPSPGQLQWLVDEGAAQLL